MGTSLKLPNPRDDIQKLLDPTRNDAHMIQVRRTVPYMMLEGRGHADPADFRFNDQTIQDIRNRKGGAPVASRYGVPSVPAKPAGPAVPPSGIMPGSGAMDMPIEPPQRPQGPPMGSRIPGSPMNPMSAPGGLSSRGVRPIGRSMRDAPERRLEQLARQGNVRAASELVGLKQTGAQRDFQREMNDVNFQQSMTMNAAQQQAQDARQQQDRVDRMGMWSAEQSAREKQQADHWQQQLTLHGMSVGEDAMKADRERQQQEADRTRVPMVGTIPVPGTDYVIPTADGRAMGTLPSKQPDAKPPAGLVPQAADINGVRYGPPSSKTERPHIEMIKQPDGSMLPHSVHVDPKTGEVVMRKVKIIDANKDGIDDREQGGAGGTAGPKTSSFLND